MPVLPNNKHELFAQGLAKGLSADAAYQPAGYKQSRSAASRLSTNVNIRARVEELQNKAAEKVELSKAWVLARLKQTVERAMQAVPVLDHEGKPTGGYTFHGAISNKALELIGRELGMFVARKSGDEPNPLFTLRASLIDASPEETREQWFARRRRELGVAPALVLEPAAGATRVRDND
jgi:phage terminase small subunit